MWHPGSSVETSVHRVLTGGEVGGGVRGALLVVQGGERVQLVRGAGEEVAQRVRALVRARRERGGPARSRRQRRHLEPEAGVAAAPGRAPRHHRLLVLARRHRQVRGWLRRCSRDINRWLVIISVK